MKILYAPLDHRLTRASPPVELDRNKRASAIRVKRHSLTVQKNMCFPQKQSQLTSAISDIPSECYPKGETSEQKHN